MNKHQRLKTMLKTLQREEGWTLVETLLVIGIVLFLTSTVGFSAIRHINKAQQVSAKTQIETFSTALNTYYLDSHRFPTEEQGLQALWVKPAASPVPATWSGPYLTKAPPADPWGNAYIYKVPGPNGLPFAIISLGADGQEGGEGNDQDITSFD